MKEKGLTEPRDRFPTAILAYDDGLAVGVLQSMLEKGFKVPEDLSIMGLGNFPSGKYSSPRLSTVGVSRVELAETISFVLRESLFAGSVPKKVELSGKLFIRQTTAPPKNQS